MDLDLIRHHAEALKDVVDIQINDSQDVVTFGRVGRVIWKRTVPAVLVIAAAIAYGCVLLTVEAVILAVLATTAVCAYLARLFRKISVNILEKSLFFSLFNIMFSEILFSEYRGPLVYNAHAERQGTVTEGVLREILAQRPPQGDHHRQPHRR